MQFKNGIGDLRSQKVCKQARDQKSMETSDHEWWKLRVSYILDALRVATGLWSHASAALLMVCGYKNKAVIILFTWRMTCTG